MKHHLVRARPQRRKTESYRLRRPRSAHLDQCVYLTLKSVDGFPVQLPLTFVSSFRRLRLYIIDHLQFRELIILNMTNSLISCPRVPDRSKYASASTLPTHAGRGRSIRPAGLRNRAQDPRIPEKYCQTTPSVSSLPISRAARRAESGSSEGHMTRSTSTPRGPAGRGLGFRASNWMGFFFDFPFEILTAKNVQEPQRRLSTLSRPLNCICGVDCRVPDTGTRTAGRSGDGDVDKVLFVTEASSECRPNRVTVSYQHSDKLGLAL
ncbi:hypothetical protein B0T21DRAFT_199006 [Apiosordaria backusii]|uniref:Uncharacterized protein n=1 Tax=Apiosordaria backusii TaxID=314023 RepID=A0AA40EET2_9PEZI|nr:hypothetical protein B0T21DRAFT_199006 [Apiosordaria backusii]